MKKGLSQKITKNISFLGDVIQMSHRRMYIGVFIHCVGSVRKIRKPISNRCEHKMTESTTAWVLFLSLFVSLSRFGFLLLRCSSKLFLWRFCVGWTCSVIIQCKACFLGVNFRQHQLFSELRYAPELISDNALILSNQSAEYLMRNHTLPQAKIC